MSIDKQTSDVLRSALMVFHMEELRELCLKLSLKDNGKKLALIGRIVHFVTNGEVIAEEKISAISLAKRGHVYPLEPDIVMLKGAYKNDLRTRIFFTGLIGEHFHFTAFGIDWLNERWMSGSPPTYREFAKMWQGEHLRRQISGSDPKEEWAYIRFTQEFIVQYPHASRSVMHQAWEDERQKGIKMVNDILWKVQKMSLI